MIICLNISNLVSEEEEKFKKALASLQVDKEKLEQERDALQRKGESGEAQLRSQLKEVISGTLLFEN